MKEITYEEIMAGVRDHEERRKRGRAHLGDSLMAIALAEDIERYLDTFGYFQIGQYRFLSQGAEGWLAERYEGDYTPDEINEAVNAYGYRLYSRRRRRKKKAS